MCTDIECRVCIHSNCFVKQHQDEITDTIKLTPEQLNFFTQLPAYQTTDSGPAVFVNIAELRKIAASSLPEFVATEEESALVWADYFKAKNNNIVDVTHKLADNPLGWMAAKALNLYENTMDMIECLTNPKEAAKGYEMAHPKDTTLFI